VQDLRRLQIEIPQPEMNTDRNGFGTGQYLTVPALAGTKGIAHAFTTRKNGLGARNKGIKLPDDWNAVAAAFGISPGRLVTVNQVHGEHIVRIDGRGLTGDSVNPRTIEADAMITNAPGIAIGVETADCVPLLLYDPGVPAVAAVHAGWRSTVRKIVDKTVVSMGVEFGSCPQRIIAAIGPAIGPECYEVDEPVMAHVREAFSYWQEIAVPRGNDRWGLDLVKANVRELLKMGLLEQNINALGLCTSCRRDLFYSFRAEGRTGRMLSAVLIRS
jgi:YfiH family protein